ncbi:MAG: protein-ADP-ribose hydrolase [Firmicutes bacterium]|nr:protein-ADP-ribose hydrolase [Bacillota bacterium]
MTQDEKRVFLIQTLLQERTDYAQIELPVTHEEQFALLRSLMNIRPPEPISGRFLQIQDEYLQTETTHKGVTELSELRPIENGIYLWQGDITTLRCDAIVNAANSDMLGCFCPCHACIDNAIHTYSGVQLRLVCAKLMKEQGYKEPTGKAKITPAFNLPCKYVLHTVGPIIQGKVTERDKELLASCYRSCLETAVKNGLQSVAFCCISTGEYHFPNRMAAEIAINTVKYFRKEMKKSIKVIFNVYKEKDYSIYQKLLS